MRKRNYLQKINFKKTCLLETEMKKIYELKKKSALVGMPDAKITFTDAPYV